MNINWTFEILDTIISLSGKYARWLNAKRIKECFLIWTACTLYWAVRDFELGLYSQCFFCIFSIGLNLYGYFKWKEKDSGLQENLQTK